MKPWELPSVIAAVAVAPPLDPEVLETLRLIFAGTEEGAAAAPLADVA